MEMGFPANPALEVHDALGEMLGAGDGIYRYTFMDAVKLAGHACPTVAGAYVMAIRACALLYCEGEMPERGGLRVTVHGDPGQGATGPFSQVLTLLTGAAADNGFGGLAGQHVRRGLLRFAASEDDGPLRVGFERVDGGGAVTLAYDPSGIAPEPTMAEDLQAVLGGTADAAVTGRFQAAWRSRVNAIVRDGGRNTIRRMD